MPTKRVLPHHHTQKTEKKTETIHLFTYLYLTYQPYNERLTDSEKWKQEIEYKKTTRKEENNRNRSKEKERK